MSSARNVTDIPGRAHVSEGLSLSRRFGFRSLIITVAIAPAAAAATVSPPSKSFEPFFIAYQEQYDSNARSQNGQGASAATGRLPFQLKHLSIIDREDRAGH